MKAIAAVLLLSVALLPAVPVEAQAPPPPPPYGAPITLEQAKKVVAAAEAESKKNNWGMVIAVLDPGGHLVMLERMDSTQFGSIEVAMQKAFSAVSYRRSTKVFEDGLAQGPANMRLLRLHGAIPIEGGLPLVLDGKVVGSIGVSGGTAPQDGQVAKAGMDALK
jgi:uncharacterized protein GlcG (DUF336 family)